MIIENQDNEFRLKAGHSRAKKGLSAIVTTVLLIGLAIVLVGIIWLAITNLVNKQINSASCVDVTGKVSINNRYTCYNSTSNELQFSISIGDIDVNSVLVGIAGQGTSVSLTIKNSTSQIPNLVTYPARSADVKIPGKNGGLTYILNLTAAGFSGAPDSIDIAPVIGTNQCSAADTLNQIDNCALLA